MTLRRSLSLRAALAPGIDPRLAPLDALMAWVETRKTLNAQQPITVKDAPFLENSTNGRRVDLPALPAPYWHGMAEGSQ